MALGKRLINTGAAACTTDTADVFGDSNGIALYTLDYDASDASGNYDGTPSDVTFGVGGQINYGARFNGSSSYIAVGSPIPNTDTNAAISAWVKLSSGISSNMHITGTGITSAGSEAPFRATLQYQSANTFRIFALRQVAGTYYLADNSTLTDVTINADTWYHIVWSYNSTGRKLSTFLNGTAIDTDVAMTTSGSSVNDSSTVIGSFRSTSGPFFSGDLDQIRFFTSTLTQANAATLHAEEDCVYTATTTDNYYPLADGSSDAVAYYKLDNSAEDSVSTNDGTETDIEYRFGRFGQAAVFNGSSSKVTTSLDFDTLTDYTISMWIKIDASPSARDFFAGTLDSSAKNGIYLANNTDETIRFYERNASGDTMTITSTDTINIGSWNHIVAVRDGNTDYLYINNGTPVSASNSTITHATGFTFGIAGAYATYFDGSIDQVRIYSTALTSDQVTELYNEKPETDTSTFKTVLYEGTGSTQYISNVGFNLDVDNGGDGGLVWIKARDTANSHALFDTVRGATNQLSSDLTAQEASYSTVLSSFDANGFFVETSSIVNTNNDDYVAWVWKAGGDAVSNTDGTNITSSVSANTTAGFSIVKWTGDANSSSSVGHGLTVNGENMLVIMKDLDSTSSDWMVITNNMWSTPTTSYLKLNTTQQVTTGSGTPYLVNNTVFKNTNRNISGNDYIAYCFHSVSGVSKIGSYEGLGTSTVTVSDVGFKPSFIMIKNVDATANWNMYDVRRSTVADRANKILYPNLANSEPSATNYYFDMNDSGFVVSATNHEQHNFAGRTYLYMAFK